MPSEQPRTPKSTDQKYLPVNLVIWGFAVAFIALAWAMIFYKINGEHEADLALVQRNNQNLSRVFQEHTIRTIQGVDQALLFLKYEYERSGGKIDMPSYVRSGVVQAALFTQMGIINEKGILTHSSLGVGVGINLADRAHFRAHVPSDTGQIFVGESLIGRTSKKWSIQFSRRINKPDGSFGGVVVVSLDPQYLTSFYRDIALGVGGSVTLIGADGKVRARRQGNDLSYGQDLSASSVIQTAIRDGHGMMTQVSRVDGVKRIYIFDKVKDYPLWVFVASAEEEALATARDRAKLYQSMGVFLSAMALGFAFFITRNIRKRRLLLEELARESAYARSLIEANLDPMMTISAEGKITDVNQATESLTGHRRHKLLGSDFADYFTDPENARGVYKKAFSEGKVVDYPLVIRNTSGLTTDVLYNVTVLRNEAGEVEEIFASARDVTEKKKLDQELATYREHLEALVQERTRELSVAKQAAEAANVAKSAFLANMSHEIRTPLNVISGLAHMIRSEGLTPAQCAQMERLTKASHHLATVINDILDLSKIEAGKFALRTEPFRLEDLPANVESILKERLQHKGLEWAVEMPQEFLPPLQGDATRLQQALLNYADNAIKFTERGRITLRIRLMQDYGNAVLVRFEVEDTGIGITPEAVDRLFTPFEQADNTLTRQYGGTGLGLTITRKIAQLMSGEAGASSMPGQGSTFWFSARLDKATDEPKPLPAKDSRADARAILRRDHAESHILLVEDDEITQEVAQFQLEDAGLRVDVASDGVEAVAKAKAGRYDLILMDMQMPRMNGLEATRAIRAMRRYENTPILAMTANAFAEDRVSCLEAGMDDFITKPVVQKDLYATLLHWLAATP